MMVDCPYPYGLTSLYCTHFKVAPTPDQKNLCYITKKECDNPFVKRCSVRKTYNSDNEKNRSV